MQNLLRRWRALWNPDMYHGWNRNRHYFEGWYFKVVSPDAGAALAFIPGIAMEADGRKHAFIQVHDGKAAKGYYYEFDAGDFRPATDRFALRLGDNFFSTAGLDVNLPIARGRLQFKNRHPWPRRLGAPGIMGWYSFAPFMQCYHGVVSMYHDLDGELDLHDNAVSFSKGRGYTEKDWGRSFPSSWIWTQSNHFDYPRPASLFLSVARIPWLTGHFVGFLSGFLWEGQLHTLATYTGAKAEVEVGEEHVRVRLYDDHRELIVTARPEHGAELISPLSGHMTGKVNESLRAELQVRFVLGGRVRYDGPAYHAGLEVAGPAREELAT